MVEHQPRLLGSRVRFPAGAFAIFSVSAKASRPISLRLPSTFRLRFRGVFLPEEYLNYCVDHSDGSFQTRSVVYEFNSIKLDGKHCHRVGPRPWHKSPSVVSTSERCSPLCAPDRDVDRRSVLSKAVDKLGVLDWKQAPRLNQVPVSDCHCSSKTCGRKSSIIFKT